jgi:DNA modification methylase
MIKQGDCLELMKTLPDNSIDLIFCDPPYALGSEVIIKENGKPDYKKAADFMNKWDQPDGTFWEEWFCEAKRVLKHGGHCLMFGMDRQLWFNCYYANYAGFTQKQSLYWYFISNFPKASDLSKNLDKYFGAEREVVGDNIRFGDKKPYAKNSSFDEGWHAMQTTGKITAPSTHLAKKYEGIKYSVAPLKQTNETIMVFQKPYKTGSCLHDILAMENGDDTITCGGVDIEGNRCGVSEEDIKKNARTYLEGDRNGFVKTPRPAHDQSNGRFPAQTYIDSGASEIIDLQSGVSKSTGGTGRISLDTDTNLGGGNNYFSFGDSGGASRILHKCDYEAGDYDLYHYCPKVSKSERNEGLEGFEEKEYIGKGHHSPWCQKCNHIYLQHHRIPGHCQCENPNVILKNHIPEPTKNDHPTVKPKALLFKILKLFKTPNQQVILDPFMGSGSMGISAVETDFDYIGYELDPEYFKIAEARIANTQSKAEQRLL